jgi:hypothetical protein
MVYLSLGGCRGLGLSQQYDKRGVVGRQKSIFGKKTGPLPYCQSRLMIMRQTDPQGALVRGAASVGGDRCADCVAASRVDQIRPDAGQDVIGFFVERCSHRLCVRSDDRKPDELLEHITYLITPVIRMAEPLPFERIIAEGVSCHCSAIPPGLDARRARLVHGGKGQTGDCMFWGDE